MKTRKTSAFALSFFSLAALLFLVACPTSDEGSQVLNMRIDKDNDSLLTFDSLIVKVSSKDGSFTQEVFHGVLRDPKQVLGMPLDPRVGKEYKVSIVGYKDGKVGVNKEVTILGQNNFQSKDLPEPKDKDTVIIIEPLIPEILAPSDTSVAEGDSLRFRISTRNAWSGATTLTLKNTIPGAALDTAGRDPGDGYFTWRPSLTQGRIEPYAVTFVYASADRKVEKTISIKVFNTNQPPKIKVIADQKVKEGETLSFMVDATDPDHDSLTLTASGLPNGATFSSGSFTWKPTAGQAGNHPIKFMVTDGIAFDSLEISIAAGTITPLPGKPSVQGETPTRSKIPSWTWKSGGGGTGLFRYRLDNADLSAALPSRDTTYVPPTELDEGTHTLFIQEANADGAWSQSGRFSIRIDVTSPGTPNVTVNPAPLSNNPKPVWSWLSGGKGGMGVFRLRLDNGDLNSSSVAKASQFTPDQNLTEGKHTLYVQERDSAGNWSVSGEMAVRIDLTAPPAPTVAAMPASPTNNPKPDWSWTSGGSSGMGTFRLRLDNADLSGADEVRTSSFNPGKNLSEGIHTLYVQERDSAGNWSVSGEMAVRIDLTPPAPPIFDSLPQSPLNSLQPTWSWKSGGGGNGLYHYKLDDAKLEDGGTPLKTNSFLAPMILSAAIHTLYIQEADSAGNISAPASKSVALALREVVGSPGFSTGIATHPSLVIDSKGTPYVAFHETDNGSKGTVMRFNGTKWDAVGTAGFAPGGRYPSLALTDKGVPYVAFQDANQKVSVMRFSGTAWDFLGDPGFSEAWGYSISLALSSTGVPYVAYVDGDNGDKAIVRRFNGRAWEVVGNSPVSVGRVSDAVMTLSSKDVPYIAYADSASGYKAKAMRFNGAKWEMVGLTAISTGIGVSLSLVLDSMDVPYVAFEDAANGNKATVMTLIGTAWKAVGSPGFSPGVVSSPSLILTSAGLPCIAFTDRANFSKATVMRFNGTGWDAVGGTGISVAGAYETSMALNSIGVPYVAFYDAANGNKVTVIKTSFDP